MAAITWQNVNAPSDKDRLGFLGLTAGMGSINAGFDNFNKIIQDREKLDSANWDQVKTNNTNAYMDELASAKTPEELAAKQAILASLQQNAGAQIDRNAIRTANDGRGAILQNRAVADIGYKNSLEDAAVAPLLERMRVAAVNGDKETVAATQLELGARRGAGNAAVSADTAARQIINRGYEDTNQGFKVTDEARKAAEAPIHLQQIQSQIDEANSRKTLLEAQAKAATAEAEASSGTSSKRLDAAYEEVKKNSSFSAGAVGTKEGDDYLTKWVDDNIKNQSEKADILYNLGKLTSKGVTKVINGKEVSIPIPASYVTNAIRQSTDAVSLIPGWSRRGDDAMNILRAKILEDHETIIGDHEALNQFSNAKITKGLPTPSATVTKGIAVPAVSTQLASKEAPKPTTVETVLKSSLLGGDNSTGISFEDVSWGKDHPKLNDPVWMAEQRRKAREKNARLPANIKAAAGIKD